ncbi:MAG: CPBP family intramembrane metalloprotease [Acidobacteria bacterium]|nr:CPBP family intramembrane metalloprotease [Acidobacteriota bacterium]
MLAFFAVLVPSLLLTPDVGTGVAFQSVLLQFFLVGSVPLAFAHLLNLEKRSAFSLRAATLRNLLWCLVLAFSLLFLLDELVLWQEQLTGVQASLSPEIQRLLRADSAPQLLWIFFAMALTPAICEELLFRGFILSRFLETGQTGQSVMMTSLLFGLFHRNLPALLPTTIAGVLLALVVWRTGSLYGAIVMHAVVNAWAILLVNTTLGDFLPWTRQASHVPVGLLLLCALGIVVAGKQLSRGQISR